MKLVRYAAAATIVMSLFNLPIAFDAGGQDIAAPIAWAITVLVVMGLVIAVGLLRSVEWAPPAVIVVGALNLLGGVVALLQNSEGALVGAALGAITLTAGMLCARSSTAAASRPARTASEAGT